jgi:SAM-dependent methyltransferase
MGLSCASAEMIIQEHLYRPIKGKVLLIGRQNTDITPQAWINLLQLYGLSPRVPIVLEERGSLEHKTVGISDDLDRIADVTVFQSLSDCQVLALDISDYEGAEVVHDLNLPLPRKYKGQFDFVFDGSCLDNIFNVTQALFSMSEMLKPGGRLVLYNTSNSHPTGYLQFSPDWVWDYFAVNDYADCKVYVHEFPDAGDAEEVRPDPLPPGGFPPQGGCLWHFDPLVVYSDQFGFQNTCIRDKGMRFFHSIAEKGRTSTTNKSPVQMHYRAKETALYIEAAKRFRASPRPLFYPRTGEKFDAPSISYFQVVYPLTRWSRRSYPKQEHTPHQNASPAIAK